MAYKMKTDGMEELEQLLSRMGDIAPGVAAGALYEGAHIMAQEILKQMDRVKTAPFKYARSNEMRLPSPEEKEVLEKAGVGIAKFDKDGLDVNTSVGFNQSGYADVNFKHMSSTARTNYKAVSMKGNDNTASSFLRALKKAGRGDGGKGAQNRKPIGVIANSINSGTSFMKKQPFVRKGANAGAPKAVAKMKAYIENAYEKLNK